MSDSNAEACRKNAKSPVQLEVTDQAHAEEEEVERLRRSERTRTLTEKGRELQEKKLRVYNDVTESSMRNGSIMQD